MPPSTCITCPVIYELSSDAKNFTSLATSFASPNFPSGIWLFILSFISSFSTSVILVCMYPGATALTKIFLLPSSFARLFVNPIIPAFDAA